MADREHSPTHGPDAPREGGDPAAPGNRPASGARVVDHPTSFSAGFGGGAEATDFLGLSQELSTMDTAALHGHPADGSATGAGEYPTEPESSASWLLKPEQIFQGGGDMPAPESHDEAKHAPQRKRGLATWHKIAAALLVAGAGAYGWFQFSGRSGTDGPEPVASHGPRTQKGGAHTPVADPKPDGGWNDPNLAPLTGTGAAGTNPDATGTAPAGGEVAIDLTPPAAAPRIGEQRLAQWVAEHGLSPNGDPSDPASGAPNSSGLMLTTLLGVDAHTSPTAMPPAGALGPEPTPTPEVAAGTTSDPANALHRGPHSETTPANSPIGGLRLATPEELAGIWPADTIPIDSMDADPRLLTPAVGNVHVIMKTGDIFDGRLYAIGTGQVWLETSIGRLALAGSRVRTITVVTLEDENGKKVEDLPRMRVRTPGGIFFGKVVSHEDDRVTLLTEDGGKITLVSRDVEPAPLGDTRVIGRVEKP
jgi:hypothetical protein